MNLPIWRTVPEFFFSPISLIWFFVLSVNYGIFMFFTGDEDESFSTFRSSLRARRDRLARRETLLNSPTTVRWAIQQPLYSQVSNTTAPLQSGERYNSPTTVRWAAQQPHYSQVCGSTAPLQSGEQYNSPNAVNWAVQHQRTGSFLLDRTSRPNTLERGDSG